MKQYQKPFSYTLTIEDQERGKMIINASYTGCRFKKSCFSTEKAARKQLEQTITLNERYGRKILGWTLTENDEIIDQMKEEI